MKRTMLGVLLALGVIAGCSRPPVVPPQGGPLVLADVTVIDGTGAPLRPHQTLIVEDGRITALFPAGSQPLPAGARTLEVAGAYVMPGLIDAHVHLASSERPPGMVREILRYALLGGVTTVRDMGGSPRHVGALIEASRADSAALPRVYGAAVVAGPAWFATYDPARVRFWSDGHTPGAAPGVRVLTDTTDVGAVVREAAALGVTGVKVYADVSPARFAALAAEAHRHGLRVWSHAVVPPTRPGAVVAGGADVMSHADQLMWAAVPPGSAVGDRAARSRLLPTTPPDAPAVRALLDTMRAAGTLLEPTLFVMQAGRGERVGPDAARADSVAAWAVAVTRLAHARGVALVAGTDALGGETPNIHAELQLLVRQAGLTPLEAIRAATLNGARALGVEGDVGTVEVGRRADLLVLAADPAADIRNTQAIRYVIRGGYVHARTGPWETPQLAEPPPGRR